ncbi:MAG TPA: cyclic 2,3-diphosphoglycerate synthase [Candidatus Marinimicrobia bacterium]|jgi:predicted GTPase|nr:cyclic 2,3-diphosphoglycerate synthase [Candidatus Neomarinimicrobiota bacterium]MDP7653295.1 cyclic 2,3-diphosphoglycerate synthase [Candidatus Neomarinimicrobiota bacterium]HBN46017.1 GTPase [Candidatus Neomarinimicrobiota bacterium]HJL74921.1 cyclic 2,3-diphosphoglycerate synthase [Candidatus Neomarinimicrobiota bacterium]HJM69488.1 cyclic 2,3-diphosphoglycerate synthase [Candidatus Neomarinimicrobiota bacterium]
MKPIKTIIMGAAGRDFHNFNVVYRHNEQYEVVAFTATQIPDIEGRNYPPALAGALYPEGIPIYDENELERLIQEHHVEEVVFSYSDISYDYVMHMASRVLALGAHFKLLGGEQTMIRSTKPVVSVCAVRTGCGKSQTTRKVAAVLKAAGKKVAAIRHPMPYGDLAKQGVQRFATLEDLQKHDCTIEEMEEYEPHINQGTVVFAGADYEAIAREAEKEADIILWDGGNNDMSFYKPDLAIVVTDPHRPGHELAYYPGETNLIMADVVIINKVDTADHQGVETVRNNIKAVNPGAVIIEGASPITVEDSDLITGKKVLVVEDGPTLTHGEMKIGAGMVAAEKFNAAETVDPRPFLVGKLQETFAHYPKIGTLLPAMGYGDEQIQDLEATINNTECDLVIIGTPIDLRRIIDIKHPSVRVTYDLEETSTPTVADVLQPLLQ